MCASIQRLVHDSVQKALKRNLTGSANEAQGATIGVLGYTSVFTLDDIVHEEFFKFTAIVASVTEKLGPLQGTFAGTENMFRLEHLDNQIIGEIPVQCLLLPSRSKKERQSAEFVETKPLTIFSVMPNCVVSINFEFRGIRSPTLPLYFIPNPLGKNNDDGGGIRVEGVARKAVVDEFVAPAIDTSTTVTAHCTPLAVAALAGWSLMKMIEGQEMPGEGGCIQTKRLAAQSVWESGCVSDQTGGPTLPQEVWKIAELQRHTRVLGPVNPAEFKAAVHRLASDARGLADGAGGLLTQATVALGQIVDPCRGAVPTPLKAALFYSLAAADRVSIEAFHSSPQTVRESEVADIFCKASPGESALTVFSFRLTSGNHTPRGAQQASTHTHPVHPSAPTTNAIIENPVGFRHPDRGEHTRLDRFEAVACNLQEARFWRPIDSLAPEKNAIAARMRSTDNFPLPPAFETAAKGELRTRMHTRACEIAPSVWLYVEGWPHNVRSRTAPKGRLSHVVLAVGQYAFHSVTGVSASVARFIVDRWLSEVPLSQTTQLLQAV